MPHITLKSIANNTEIDTIWQRWQDTLEPLREDLNSRLDRDWEEWQIPQEPGDPWPDAATKAWHTVVDALQDGSAAPAADAGDAKHAAASDRATGDGGDPSPVAGAAGANDGGDPPRGAVEGRAKRGDLAPGLHAGGEKHGDGPLRSAVGAGARCGDPAPGLAARGGRHGGGPARAATGGGSTRRGRPDAATALATVNEVLDRHYTLDDLPERPYDPWKPEATESHRLWWEARIARQQEIDAAIAARADVEHLYDKPYEDPKRVRVAGPFTVESLSPHRLLAFDEADELIDRVAERAPAYGTAEDFAAMALGHLATSGVQQAHKADRLTFSSVDPWPGQLICAQGRYTEGDDGPERRAGIVVGPEFGTVARQDLVRAAREAGDAGFDVLVACAFNFEPHATEFNRLGALPVLKARMNADLHMADDLANTGKGNLFVIFGEPDIEIRPADGDAPETDRIQVRIHGVDVFHPSTGEVRSDGPDGIACWFIDTDYNDESFFVRQAYFLGANDPYRALRTTLKAENRRRRVGDPAQRHVPAVRPPGVGPHRRQGHQPPRGRGDEGVRLPLTRKETADDDEEHNGTTLVAATSGFDGVVLDPDGYGSYRLCVDHTGHHRQADDVLRRHSRCGCDRRWRGRRHRRYRVGRPTWHAVHGGRLLRQPTAEGEHQRRPGASAALSGRNRAQRPEAHGIRHAHIPVAPAGRSVLGRQKPLPQGLPSRRLVAGPLPPPSCGR